MSSLPVERVDNPVFGKKDWFKEVIVYQIWPTSFADTEGTGVGGLKGVTSKLDHLKGLGVDVVWLSPIMASPMKDMGYDISNYREIRKEFGTMEDWEELKDALHAKGLRLMMDLVVNHTSDQHEWFKESRSSKFNPKRNWYIWHPGKASSLGRPNPPNNWVAAFGSGESAWTWDEQTQEYYLRLFCKEQPDLNWENAEVRNAVHEIMRFWMDKGCDGFRMDVINLIAKAPGFPDSKPVLEGYLQPSAEHAANQPMAHEYLKEMHSKVLSHYDAINVGECPRTNDTKVLLEYSRPENKELQMVFSFELHYIDGWPGDVMKRKPFTLQQFKDILARYQVDLWEKGWNSLYLSNHDQARPISRWATDDPQFRQHAAKMLATLLNTLCGTVYVYQGDEIGMSNVPPDWTIDDLPDVATKMYWDKVLKERQLLTGCSEPDMSDVLESVLKKARDNGRTPFQWNRSANAGFTTGTPWMKVNPDYLDGWNVEDQQSDPSSVLNYFKKIIQLRKDYPILIHGSFTLLDPDTAHSFSYLRKWEGVTILVLLSFSPDEYEFDAPSEAGVVDAARVLISTYGDEGRERAGRMFSVRPFEGVVYLLGSKDLGQD